TVRRRGPTRTRTRPSPRPVPTVRAPRAAASRILPLRRNAQSRQKTVKGRAGTARADRPFLLAMTRTLTLVIALALASAGAHAATVAIGNGGGRLILQIGSTAATINQVNFSVPGASVGNGVAVVSTSVTPASPTCPANTVLIDAQARSQAANPRVA